MMMIAFWVHQGHLGPVQTDRWASSPEFLMQHFEFLAGSQVTLMLVGWDHTVGSTGWSGESAGYTRTVCLSCGTAMRHRS